MCLGLPPYGEGGRGFPRYNSPFTPYSTWVNKHLDTVDCWEPSSVSNEDWWSTFFERYVASIYWAMVTISTVGYGDIGPVNPVEQLCGFFLVMFGAVVFAHMVGKMSAVAQSAEAASLAYEARMDEVDSFMKHRGLPRHLRSEIRHAPPLSSTPSGLGPHCYLASRDHTSSADANNKLTPRTRPTPNTTDPTTT